MARVCRRLGALTMALALAVALSGCWSGEITVTQEDASTIQVARVGDRVTIRLEGNPSTGHTWTRTAPSDEEFVGLCLEPIEEGTWQYPDDEHVPGAGGVCLFRYLAEASGDLALSFTYGRAWEPEPVQTFSVVVRVRE